MSDSEADIVYDKVVLGSFDRKIFRSENIDLDRIFTVFFVIFFYESTIRRGTGIQLCTLFQRLNNC